MAVAARYLNRELFSVFVVVVLVLLTVAIGGRFIGYLQDAAMGKYAAESLLTIMWLRLPEYLQQLLPFAFFVALLLTLGRFHAEQEMAVLQGGGVGPGRLLAWLAPASVALALIVGYLSLSLTPANVAVLEAFLAEQRKSQEFEAVSPGVFRTYRRGSGVSYAETVSEDRRELGEVFIAEHRADQSSATVWAQTGTQYVDPQTGSRFMILNDGARYEGRIGDPGYRVTEFGTLGQRLAVVAPAARGIRMQAVATSDLRGNASAKGSAELQWRYSLVLLPLVGTCLGLGLARVKPRQGRFARIVPGIMVFVAYYLCLVMAQNAINNDSWPTSVGLWPVHGLFVAVALLSIHKVARPARG